MDSYEKGMRSCYTPATSINTLTGAISINTINMIENG